MGCLVSVIIPTYKRKLDYVSNAMQSVINQTYDNVEIVVVDDSPSDFPYRDEIKNYSVSSITFHSHTPFLTKKTSKYILDVIYAVPPKFHLPIQMTPHS